MSKRPYQHLPPLEHRPDGSPYRITPPQKRRASGLIRRECCNCEDGNCLALDDGDTCACPQMISFSVCCKWLSRFFDTRPLIFCNSEKVIRSQLALSHTPGGRWHTNMLRLSFMRISSRVWSESHPWPYPPGWRFFQWIFQRLFITLRPYK